MMKKPTLILKDITCQQETDIAVILPVDMQNVSE